MKILTLLTLLSTAIFASLFDFKYLSDAKQAYLDKNYSKAEKLYGKVKSDEATFNKADALYRQKKYQEAIENYQKISDPKLAAKKLHNIGNSYAQMNKLDEAVKSYEDALKIKEDQETKFNLELLKKKKKEQEQKKRQNKKERDKENKNNQNNQQNQKDQKEDKKQNQNKNKQNQKNDKESKKEDKDNKSQKREDQKNRDKKQKEKNEQKPKERDQQQAHLADQNQTKPPISNMEERKWQKMLNNRGVNTLMIPLNKGDNKNETNPW